MASAFFVQAVKSSPLHFEYNGYAILKPFKVKTSNAYNLERHCYQLVKSGIWEYCNLISGFCNAPQLRRV